MNNHKNHILVIAAMQEELAFLKTIPEFKTNHRMLVTGIGKVNAAYKLGSYLIKNRNYIDEILDVGYACGLNSQLNIGDVCFSIANSYHDVDLTTFGYKKGQIPGSPQFFYSDTKLLNYYFKKINNFLKKHYPKITVHKTLNFSGDIFVERNSQLPDLLSLWKDDLSLLDGYTVDMESCAYSQIAHHQKIPITSLHIITDNLVTSKATTIAYSENKNPVQNILNGLLTEILK